jgi:osmoprotectant transport system ATP-binding protein
VRAGEDTAAAKAKLADADLPYLLLVDDRGRPKGWLSDRALSGERIVEDLRSSADPIVEMDDILRDALSDLLAADTRYGPVVDEAGAVRGILSLEAVGHALAATGGHVPTATELARESAAHDGRATADGLSSGSGSDLARS